jgi:hypothetical protein
MRQGMPSIEQVWQEDSPGPISLVKEPPEALRPHIPDVADKLLDQAIKKPAPIYPLIALKTQNSSFREFFIRRFCYCYPAYPCSDGNCYLADKNHFTGPGFIQAEKSRQSWKNFHTIQVPNHDK